MARDLDEHSRRRHRPGLARRRRDRHRGVLRRPPERRGEQLPLGGRRSAPERRRRDPPVRNVTAWHTYGVGIHPDRLEYSYDGVKVRTITATTAGIRRGLSYAHSIVLNLAVGGSSARDAGYRAGTAALPYAAEFDHVRVWQP